MKTNKILMLAAATALSIGAGAAMAQNATPNTQTGYQQQPVARQATAPTWNQESTPQYGSSDHVSIMPSPAPDGTSAAAGGF